MSGHPAKKNASRSPSDNWIKVIQLIIRGAIEIVLDLISRGVHPF